MTGPHFAARKWLAGAAVLLCALGFSCVTAPFRGADEFNHFFRACQIADGHLISTRFTDRIIGERLPDSLRSLAIQNGFPNLPPLRTTAKALQTGFALRLEPAATSILSFSNTSLYSPFHYAGAALGIRCARCFSDRPLVHFYAGRFGSAFLASALFALGVRSLPAAAITLLGLPLIPMTLFQCGMITADSFTIAIIFLFGALVLRLRVSGSLTTPGRKACLLACALAFSQLRPPYQLAGLAIFAVPRFSSQGRNLEFLSCFFALLIIPCLIWNLNVPLLFSQMRPDVATAPLAQLASMIKTPSLLPTVLCSEVARKGTAHLAELIGYFGWRHLPLPAPLAVAVGASLLVPIFCLDTANLKITRALRILLIGFSLFGCLAVIVEIYVTWNALASTEVVGLHSRYFLPFLPFLMVGLSQGRIVRCRWLELSALGLGVAVATVAVWLVAHATFG